MWNTNSNNVPRLPLSDAENNKFFEIHPSAQKPPAVFVSQSWSKCTSPTVCAPTQHCKTGLRTSVCHCDPAQNLYELPLNSCNSPSQMWACAGVSDNPCVQSGTCSAPNTQCLVHPPPPSSANGSLPTTCEYIGPNDPTKEDRANDIPVALIAGVSGGVLLLVLLIAILFILLILCWRRRKLQKEVRYVHGREVTMKTGRAH